MRFIAPLLALLFATPAFAGGTVSVQAPAVSIAASTNKLFHVCFVPDIQNLTSSDDHALDDDNSTCGVKSVANGCPPNSAYCTQSPYCDTSWRNTGRRILRNMAYDLTGQWEHVDWTGMSGPNNSDGTISGATASQDHPKCDVILSLGDNSDIDDAVVCTDPTYAGLSAGDRAKWDLATEFWQIIKASGIPYLIIPGNHDPAKPYEDLIASLDFENKSFEYATHTDKDQSAIIFTGPDGKPMCAIGSDYSDTNSCVRAPTADEITWLEANSGCGGNYPTICLEHQGVTDTGVATGRCAAMVDDADHAELIAIAGGHYTSDPGSKHDAVVDGVGEFDYIPIYANWQEMNRHNNGSSPLYGITVSDSAGGFVTIMAIDRANDSVTIFDYSAYWRSRKVHADAVGVYTTNSNTLSFDYDARSP